MSAFRTSSASATSDGAESTLPSKSLGSRPPTSAARLSINQTTTVRWPLLRAIDEYRAAGAAGIGISLRSLRDCGIGLAASALAQSGLQVSSLGWVGGFTGTNGHSFTEALTEARLAIHAAQAVGARSLILVAGALNGHIRSHARRLLVEALLELTDDAASAGVRLALQPMHPIFEVEWSFLNGLDETLELLARCDLQHVGMAFGTYHLWQEPRLIERIPEILPHVALVQLSDWRDPPRCDNDRLIPGDGSIPVAEIVTAFESAGYRGTYEIEIWSRDLWKRDHRCLIQECMLRCARLLTFPT